MEDGLGCFLQTDVALPAVAVRRPGRASRYLVLSRFIWGRPEGRGLTARLLLDGAEAVQVRSDEHVVDGADV